MLRAITWTAVLAGVASFTEGTDIWLNELKVSRGDDDAKFSIDVEFVGHPLTMEYPTKPAKLEAKLQFYNGDAKAGGEVDAELATSQDGNWDGNYVGQFECEIGSGCAAASAAALGGVKVTYGEVSNVYCWGTTADNTNDSPIGDGETCGGSDYILTGYLRPTGDNTFTDIALYDKALGFRGASANDDWEYKVSLSEDDPKKPYDTLGFLNVCGDVEADPALECDGVAVQTIEAYTYDPPDNSGNEDEVWLNELDITVGSSNAVTANLELVGGPTGDGDAPNPLAVDVRFYSADAEIEAATPLPVPMTVSSVEEWEGHYVGTIEVTDRALAFPAGSTIGGIQLEWTVGETTTKAVYCWGTSAAANARFGASGSEVTCQHVVKTGGPVRGGDGSHSNRALFGWSGTTAGGGKLPKDFYWTDSKESDGTIFQTITTINACGTAGDCDPLVDQKLAKYSWSGGVPPSTGSPEAGMWLNELKVTDAGGDKSLEVELVGQPLTMDYPTVPVKLEAKLQFYNGDANAGDEVVAELITRSTSDDAKLGGNYLGRYECAAGTACADATAALLGGVKVTYGGVSNVYCWGRTADSATSSPIGPVGDNEKCGGDGYVLTGYEPPTSTFTDIALYDTSNDSGKDQDWTWKVSKNTATTAVPFDTLGKVNVCADSTQDVSDCGTALVQTIAAYEYTEPPANTNTDEVWLNELDITVSSTNGVTAKLEIVGGLTASTPVEVKFYLGNEEVESESDEWKPVELVESSKPEWNSHYVGTVDVPADLSTAFPVSGDLAGLQLKWGEKTAVYCWGSTAAIDSKLGEDEVQCKTVVKTGGAIRGAGDGSYNRALFNWSETPANGGTSAGHFYWTDSKNGGAAFDSIGDVNVCEDDGDCIPTDQKLGLNGEEEVETPPDEEKEEETPSSGLSLFICSWRLHAAVVIGLMTVMQFIR